ncbi:DNA-binding protein (plasmid) [Mycobacterium paragordonae]|jgi:Zn-dependent peptidase ImmA (M78 family)|uniref:ImmA/IrrE family metallo-endopeptidase n=1 Tax=Mycobacterium paragordonae TaxID=1389713 RepID=A0AAJ1SCK1_9MYCO|nr:MULTISPECIES: ImmA/IrrE family metallo-endopeptidase [Mycobacterium]RUP04136.1 MAG: ImmA/IrrE family metallo-endopeptidase [Mycobacterium sp.]AYE99580.1 DNA-binding protein [Mycobacterium paragordonae]MDP7739169.1 ImmA/IrrE family metallo-endopeptidase [Mycobacterium paragordonae]QNI09755.1 ImmA/IrrE family metallo-endopeptidase [Mycobacterium kubicae]TDK94698.1 ImmA/IrrE family metallo-endopeptidase [Mycobacterium paragordonae]
MTTVEVFGVRVRQARVLRRLSGTAVMDHMGWRSPRQTRLEQAETALLDATEFNRLATLLRFPAAFFTTAPVSRVFAHDLLFRAPKSTRVTEKEYLAVFANVVGDLLDQLNGQAKLPAVRLEPLPAGTDVVTAAAQARQWLGVEPGVPIKSLTYELEAAGVPVVLRMKHSRISGSVDWDSEDEDPAGALTEKHLGCSARTGAYRERPVVLLRALDSWERTRWTIAHEIGHLVLHRYGDVSDAEEREASRFASELLAPAEAIAPEIPVAPTLNDLVDVKLKWRISLGALILHLRESKLIDNARAETLQKQLYTRINTDTGHTWGKTEPGWDARKPERPRLLRKWIEACYGTASAEALMAHNLIFPADLMADVLAGQRDAPGRARLRVARVKSAGDGDGEGPGDGGQIVVPFERARRQA